MSREGDAMRRVGASSACRTPQACALPSSEGYTNAVQAGATCTTCTRHVRPPGPDVDVLLCIFALIAAHSRCGIRLHVICTTTRRPCSSDCAPVNFFYLAWQWVLSSPRLRHCTPSGARMSLLEAAMSSTIPTPSRHIFTPRYSTPNDVPRNRPRQYASVRDKARGMT